MKKFLHVRCLTQCLAYNKPSKNISQKKKEVVLGWPKSSFSFFHTMALVVFSCL